MMACPVCSSSKIEMINVNHPIFRHYDFATIKGCGSIDRCSVCQFLFNTISDQEIGELDTLLRSEAYARSEQTGHILNVDDYKQPVTRCFLQAELLSKLVPSEHPSIMDIGCFDGALLAELDKRFPSAELHGLDVNEYLRTLVPKSDNFHFHTSGMEDIYGPFDLICMSHSIQYVADIPDLMTRISSLLKPDGILFVQTADISNNPWSVLLGDQFSYYTPSILANVLQHCGFEFSLMNNNWFPREIVGVAKASSNGRPLGYTEDKQISRCMESLSIVAQNLEKLDPAIGFGVLGTTINAAFVEETLGTPVEYFVDENLHRVGEIFRSKKVFHPKSLHASDSVVISYGGSGHKIKERFSNIYSGEFICV